MYAFVKEHTNNHSKCNMNRCKQNCIKLFQDWAWVCGMPYLILEWSESDSVLQFRVLGKMDRVTCYYAMAGSSDVIVLNFKYGKKLLMINCVKSFAQVNKD